MKYYYSAVNHPHFKEFLIYCVSLIVLGTVITGLGPMFPYLSEKEGLLETQYSFLFLCRALGYIVGSASVKILQKYLNFHQCLLIGVLLPGIFLIFFSFSESLNMRGIFIFLSSLGCAQIDIFTNVATIHCFKGPRLAIWLQILHGAFGIGGLIGPFIVFLFELNTMIVFAIAMLALAPFLYIFPSPDQKNQEDPEQFLPDPNPRKILSTKSNYLIAGIFYFVVGQEATFGGWVSSYAVLQGFSSKEHATLYSSVYWISITFFRFAFAFVPGKPSIKVYALFGIAVFQTFVSLFLIYHLDPQFGLIMTAIVFGLSNSVLFPLLLIVPDQFNLKVTPGQNSNFMLLSFMGEGTLAVFVGEVMKMLSYNWFLYSMGIINLSAMIMHYIALKNLNLEKSDSAFKMKHYESFELVDKVNSVASRGSAKDRLKNDFD